MTTHAHRHLLWAPRDASGPSRPAPPSDASDWRSAGVSLWDEIISDGNHGRPLLFIRFFLPLGLVLAGLVVLLASASAAVGGSLLAAGLILWLGDFLLRLTMRSQFDRDREELARERFMSSGHWPEEG